MEISTPYRAQEAERPACWLKDRHGHMSLTATVNPKHQQSRWLYLGRLDVTSRIASERPGCSMWLGRDDVVFTHLCCPTCPTRTCARTTPSPQHPFTRPSIAWDTTMRNQCTVCVARNKCTLRLCVKSNPPTDSMPVNAHGTFLPWLV